MEDLSYIRGKDGDMLPGHKWGFALDPGPEKAH